MFTRHFLPYKDSRIHYIRFGKGAVTVLCFHGYGEEAPSFAFLEKYAGDQCSFLAIDLPFHGQTEWKNGLDFSPGHLAEIVNLILAACGLPAGKRVLLGFSLGGRVALSLYEQDPGLVDRLILLAPDGLKVNFWYWLSTQTWMGNRVFRITMNHPGWFFWFLRFLNKLRLVNASIFKFVNHYIGDREIRILLYQRWTSLRRLRPHIGKIKALIHQNNTQVRLLYGIHDRIILSSVGQRFKSGIEDQCSLSLIHSGHQLLHEKHVDEIMPALFH